MAQRWLSSPLLGSVQASLSIPEIIGIGGGAGRTANTSAGFAESGFEDLVRQWLANLFGSTAGGGVVCCIDNLELLRTSEDARKSLEALRDVLFNAPGLRWIFCGSAGILYGLASTPRLNGVMNAPIEVKDLPHGVAKDVFRSRVAAYEIEEGKGFLPLTPEDFERLFTILHGNIRDSLSLTSDYCLWYFENHGDASGVDGAFDNWLDDNARERLDATARTVKNRAWRLFDDIVTNDGECAPGEHEKYGFNSPQAMRSHLIKLETAGLIQSLRDEDDNRRKTIVVTPVGWLIDYGKKKGLSTLYEEARSEGGDLDDEGDVKGGAPPGASGAPISNSHDAPEAGGS